MKASVGEFQHELVVADVGKKATRKVTRKTCTERRKISLLRDEMIRKTLEEKVLEMVDIVISNVWGQFKDLF